MRRDARVEQNRSGKSSGRFWLYGIHAARAALSNPRRIIIRALATEAVWRQLDAAAQARGIRPEICGPERIGQNVPQGAVHQGVALLCDPLPPLYLEETLELRDTGRRHIAVL